MTDQPNTETDAAHLDWCDANLDCGSSEKNDALVRALAIARRAVAPAPARDVEQRVSDEQLAEVCRELDLHGEQVFFGRYVPIEMGNCLALDLRDARAALAAMPSGRQRGLLEAAEDLAESLRMAMATEVGDEHLWAPQADAALAKWQAIRTAAAQLGEPDDGWLPIASAPKDGRRLWLYWPHSSPDDRQSVGWWHESIHGAWWMDHADTERESPTHWRPLLPAPSVPR